MLNKQKNALLIGVLFSSIIACGSQPAQKAYTVPANFQSQQCYVSQGESYFWLEQEDEWLALPTAIRQQLNHADINWLEENILIVSAGQKPTVGFGIELSNWLMEQDHWQVTKIDHRPAIDSLQAQMLTSPCTLVKIPKLIRSFTLKGEQGQVLGNWPY